MPFCCQGSYSEIKIVSKLSSGTSATLHLWTELIHVLCDRIMTRDIGAWNMLIYW